MTTTTDSHAPAARPMPGSHSERVVSRDGTSIAFERSGQGPAVILVDGALSYRDLGQTRELAALLARQFTVFAFDRRGRGESTDTAPYSVEREVEDLSAVLTEAGGTACVWATSSGAVLALEAAARLPGLTRLALYEAPFIVDGSRPTTEQDWARIAEALAANRRGDAVKVFLKLVGVPSFVIALMHLTPTWSKLTGVAHTLPYDGALLRDYQRGQPLPPGRWASVAVPVLALDGGESPAWMHAAMRSLAGVLPNAQYLSLEGQTHMLKPKALAPTLVRFFKGEDRV